jgi:ATP-binding cassette subfamily C protein
MARRRLRLTWTGIAVFSGALNLLALTGSFYMLQVYDRVLPSRSIPTLVGLTVLMAGLYAAFGLLDFFRARIVSRIGTRLEHDLRQSVFTAVQSFPTQVTGRGDGLEPVRDLDQIRGFLSGLGPAAVLDMPWVPVFLAVVYLLHPALGGFAAGGALLLVSLALVAELRSRDPIRWHGATAM